ncbi:pyridoxamine 5'-phosphate oxidase family protein [Stigmatella sp. ncwal1]|uniref:Pyridoxamine 5'-phosphate oxidase family protein n=1 Tax=Stigmatella ashevillensis TaxID=2995309 RepID=A0ABT5DJM5_9BACT|nr:pyridoxamine 5'-phosphate oxidase family protein [Stigmatella ashevillena]MDC0713259.1 pyridoxamine 5'-phosphate oxidase family protein [Stigmatella ashevillena]
MDATHTAKGGSIKTLEELEAIIGKAPPMLDLKVINHLDAGALRWIAASPLLFACFGSGTTLGVTLGGGPPGFAGGDARTLRLPAAMLDDPSLAQVGRGFGALFLLPGTGETLRVNGIVSAQHSGDIRITVHECYGHCAKALLRSEFWKALPDRTVPSNPSAFIDATRFMALATIDSQGHADVSPKGDLAGTLVRLDHHKVRFADRPGNRRVDSFRNILAQPHVAAALLIPGSTHVAYISGTARITSDEAVRSQFAVQDKVPALVTAMEDAAIQLHESPALARADLWPVKPSTHGIQATKLFIEHLKLNKENSLGARLASAALSVPGASGLLKKSLEKDYKDNLY